MAKGGNDKKSNADSRGSDGEGLGLEACAATNKIDFVEPEDGGGAQGAPAKNHWDGTGAKDDSADKAGKAAREPKDGRESAQGM